MLGVAQAIAYLHDMDVVYGDVKGGNILISPDGRPLLAGFGLSKFVWFMDTSTALRGAGSVRWQSPELWDGERKSFASDVYAFGMTIVEVRAIPMEWLRNRIDSVRYSLFLPLGHHGEASLPAIPRKRGSHPCGIPQLRSTATRADVQHVQ